LVNEIGKEGKAEKEKSGGRKRMFARTWLLEKKPKPTDLILGVMRRKVPGGQGEETLVRG